MSRTAPTAFALFLASLASLAAATGCATDPSKGYTTASQHRAGIDSVEVVGFTRDKEIYRRGLEMRLTEAIVKRIGLDTPYRILPKGRADTQLRGTIETISQRVLSPIPETGGARELEMILVVSFTWKDLRTGKILAQEKNLRAAGVYIPPVPFSEDFYEGSEAALNQMAVRIVEKMEADW